MTPEKEIKIGISTGCLMGKSPELALRTLFQQKEISEALKAVNEIGLDGIELLYRRGLTFRKFNRLLELVEELKHKPQVLTVHAPLYYDRHSPSFGKTDSKFASWLLAYMSGFFKNEPAPRLAQELKAPLVIHAGIIKRLGEKGGNLKGRQWLVEAEKPPLRQPTPETIYRPEEVLALAQKNGLDLVLDTSRTGLAGYNLRETWETYTHRGTNTVKVIHLSGTGGLVVHENYLELDYLAEMKEFFQQVLKDGWQGTIIIEHAPMATPGRIYKDKKDQIKYTLSFLLANEIKPRRSYSHP